MTLWNTAIHKIPVKFLEREDTRFRWTGHTTTDQFNGLPNWYGVILDTNG